jgi:hypothetical protein
MLLMSFSLACSSGGAAHNGVGGSAAGAGGSSSGPGGAAAGSSGSSTGLGGAVVGAGGSSTGLGGAVVGAGGSSTGLGAGGAGGDVVAVTAVGTPRGGVAQKMVPATGGTITSNDGRLTITVPTGALAAAQMLSIQAISNESPGGAGPAYRLGPAGQTFLVPVKLTFAYTPFDIAGSEALALRIATQDAMGRWNAPKSVTQDDVAKTVSAQTAHFSDWSLLLGWQLKPGTAVVKTGAGVDFQVIACGTTPNTTDELFDLAFKCRFDTDFFNVQEWAVNTIVNGSAAVGTLTNQADNGALYSAPATAPAGEPVAVSAKAVDKTTGRSTVLVSNVWVNEHPPLKGTITSVTQEASLVVSTTAKVKFVYETITMAGASFDDYHVKEGTLDATWDINEGGCTTHGVLAVPILPMDGQILLAPDPSSDAVFYVPSASTVGDYVGTTVCGTGTTEPFSRLQDRVTWWPLPMMGAALPYINPDGTLQAGYTNYAADTMTTTSAEWSLIPGM